MVMNILRFLLAFLYINFLSLFSAGNPIIHVTPQTVSDIIRVEENRNTYARCLSDNRVVPTPDRLQVFPVQIVNSEGKRSLSSSANGENLAMRISNTPITRFQVGSNCIAGEAGRFISTQALGMYLCTLHLLLLYIHIHIHILIYNLTTSSSHTLSGRRRPTICISPILYCKCRTV